MACGGCGGARHALYQAVRPGRSMNLGMAVQAIRQGVQVNVDKMRGTYDESKYQFKAPALKATPYRRPPERTT